MARGGLVWVMRVDRIIGEFVKDAFFCVTEDKRVDGIIGGVIKDAWLEVCVTENMRVCVG